MNKGSEIFYGKCQKIIYYYLHSKKKEDKIYDISENEKK